MVRLAGPRIQLLVAMRRRYMLAQPMAASMPCSQKQALKSFNFDADAPILTSPIYLDGRLVVSDSAGKTQAIDSATGKVIWSWEGPAPVLASPVMAGNQVIVCDRTGQVTALDIRMGRRLVAFQCT
jgi:outer membrane protein assembly factor BamB